METLKQQFGGTHYKGLAIQPVEFIAANGWDFFVGSVLKYLSRWRDKGGLVDLQKALHFAQMRFELGVEKAPSDRLRPRITMSRYVRENGIEEKDDLPLYALELWVTAPPSNLLSSREKFFQVMQDYIGEANGR